MDRLFPHKKVLILNMQKIMWVTMKFCLNVHIMTCLLVIVSSPRFEKERDEYRESKKPGEEDFTIEELVKFTNPVVILRVCLFYYVEAISFIVMT